jgi:hypothetical protein
MGRGDFRQTSGATCRDIAKACWNSVVIARSEATTQSILARGTTDCFADARNDDGGLTSGLVIAGLVPAIHVLFDAGYEKTWMPATSAGMTTS